MITGLAGGMGRGESCSSTEQANGTSVSAPLNIQGYKLLIKNRCGRPGGGVCLYISSALQVNVQDDIAITDNHSDSLFVEINIKDGKNLIVGVVYRPPDADLDMFNIKLEETLFSINGKNKNCILLGDFNIDLSRDDAVKNNFINILHSFSFFPTINTFTRVTPSTKTIIDNIITNILNTSLESGVVLSEISDNFPIVLFLDLAGRSSLSRHKIKTKVINEETLRCLRENLQTNAWDEVYNHSDVEAAFDTLTNEITDSIRRIIPERTTIYSPTQKKPWLSKGILQSIKHKK